MYSQDDNLNELDSDTDDFWDELTDEDKVEADEDRFLQELSDEFDGNPDDTVQRLEDQGYSVDDLDI